MVKDETKITLSAKEVAEILGVSLNSVYALAKSGQIRAVRIGKIYRFSKEALYSWINGTEKEG